MIFTSFPFISTRTKQLLRNPMTQNWNHQEEDEKKKKKRWISKIPTVTKRGGTVSRFCNVDRNRRSACISAKTMAASRSILAKAANPSSFWSLCIYKMPNNLLFKTIKRATHKERERHTRAIGEEGHCQSRIWCLRSRRWRDRCCCRCWFWQKGRWTCKTGVSDI